LIQGTLGLAHAAPDDASRFLDGVFELGCNAFDTAPVYGRGEAERMLGRWIEQRDVRDNVLIIDKGCHPDHLGSRVNPTQLAFDVQASLERLRVDRIDLYLLHRDDPLIPPEEMVDALERHVIAGHILAYGASNWSHQRIAQANQYARDNGLRGFVASSPGVSLARAKKTWPGCLTLSPAEDGAALIWYRESRLPLLAWSPLAGGYLADPSTAERTSSLGPNSEEFYASSENAARRARVWELSRLRGVSPVQVALAYVLHQVDDAFAVLGCSSRSEFETCVGALETRLRSDDLIWLEVGTSAATLG
jgi:aryl-alcohol dehydrogenase-like predicted oxidoreductase